MEEQRDLTGLIDETVTDEELARRYSSNPEHPYGKIAGWMLVQRYFERLHRFAQQKGLPEDDAYDIAIEAELKALQMLAAGKFEPRGKYSYRSWLFKLTANMITDYWRAMQKVKPQKLDDSHDADHGHPWPGDRERLANSTKPYRPVEEEILQCMEDGRIWCLLCHIGLTPVELMVLDHKMDRLQPRHIAELAGIPAPQVSRLLYRGKQKVRARFPTPERLREWFATAGPPQAYCAECVYR